MFTANDTAGSYTLTADSAYGTVSFSLTNSAAGIPATITPVSPAVQSADVNSGYAHQLSVRVLDTGGNPVSGVAVTFALKHSRGWGSRSNERSGELCRRQRAGNRHDRHRRNRHLPGLHGERDHRQIHRDRDGCERPRARDLPA